MTHFYKEFAHFSQINNPTAESGFCFCRTHTLGDIKKQRRDGPPSPLLNHGCWRMAVGERIREKTYRGRTCGPTIIGQGGRGEGAHVSVAECTGGRRKKKRQNYYRTKKPFTTTFGPRNRPWWMHWFETSVKKSTRTFFPPL